MQVNQCKMTGGILFMPSFTKTVQSAPDSSTLTGDEFLPVIQGNKTTKIKVSLMQDSVLKGDSGVKGEKGDTGPPGPPGANGQDGAQGPQGIQGNQGDTGSPGADGITQDISGKVDKITGKGLSTEDYSTAEKTKLAGVAAGATGDQDLSGLVVKNGAIAGATKTKITFDAKGLVTGGADATTADIADSADKRYCTDAQKTALGNIPSQLSLTEQYARELASSPRRIYMVYGDSTDGGTTPDSTTQASIDALLAAGVPDANIRWMYEAGTAGQFVVSGLTAGSTIDNVTLTLSHGVFTIQDMASSTTFENVVLSLSGGVMEVQDAASGSTIDNIVLTSGDVLIFTIADMASTTAFDNVALTQSGGVLALADMASASTIENVTLVQSGGTLAVADMVSASTMDNVVITASTPTQPVISVTPGNTTNLITKTSGGVGATSYDIHWGTVSGTRSNTISGVTLPYTHTGRTNGTPYYYSLVAINASGSSESSEVGGTPAGGAVLSATFDSNTAPFNNTWAGYAAVTWDSSGHRLNMYNVSDEPAPYATATYNRSHKVSMVLNLTGSAVVDVFLNTDSVSIANNCYRLTKDEDDALFGLYKYVNGTSTSLGTWTGSGGAAISFNTNTPLEISFSGASVIVKINNTTVITGTDSTHSDFTRLSFKGFANDYVLYIDDVVIQ
jgi:hypothetical protein